MGSVPGWSSFFPHFLAGPRVREELCKLPSITYPCSLRPDLRTHGIVVQLGLQVRVGQNLASVGEAVQEGLDFHRRASQASPLGYRAHPPTHYTGCKLASPLLAFATERCMHYFVGFRLNTTCTVLLVGQTSGVWAGLPAEHNNFLAADGPKHPIKHMRPVKFYAHAYIYQCS